MSNYFEVRVCCIKDVSEAVCSFLMENGALGAVEENVFVDKVKRKGHRDFVTAYFEDENDFFRIRGELKSFLNGLKENIPGFDRYAIELRSLKDRNWRDEYKKYFKPVKVSKRIVVKPDYEEYSPKKEERVIIINPQMAFGIGNHPTTKMCVKLLDELLIDNDDPGALSLLDAGTGSGIIAIAASYFGVGHIYGFDIDGTACDIAKENVKKNEAKNVTIACHGIKHPTKKYDIVVANILAHILIEKRAELIGSVKKSGCLILSGILDTQKDEVVSAFLKGSGLELAKEKREKEWVALLFILR